MSAREQYIKYATGAMLFVIMTAFFYLPEAIQAHLEFNTLAISQGQVWRLYTGHLTHFTFYHWIMNVTALFIVGFFIFYKASLFLWFISLLFIPLFISVCLYWSENLMIYRGFSAVIHGLVVCSVPVLFKESRLLATVLGVGLVVKVLSEQRSDFDVNHLKAYIDVPVAVDSHLYGAIAGCVCCLLWFIYGYFKKH